MSKCNVEQKLKKATLVDSAKAVGRDPLVRRFNSFMDQFRFPFEPSRQVAAELELYVKMRWITCQQVVTEQSFTIILRDIRSRVQTLVLRRDMEPELFDLFITLSGVRKRVPEPEVSSVKTAEEEKSELDSEPGGCRV